MMKIIVGLGNPGKQYVQTRHNAGRMLLETILHTDPVESEITWEDVRGICVARTRWCMLVQSKDYFMNESGKILHDLRELLHQQMSAETIYVAHDDLDIRLGEYKIQQGKGPEVHGGVNDIERVIGKDFWRIRIGVDNRGVPRTPGETYVLQKFEPEEVNQLSHVLGVISQNIA